MRLLIQRASEPIPYRGAHFRIAPRAGEPARSAVVLPAAPGVDDRDVLALLLGLVLSLGDPPGGGAPIRQYWLSATGALEGKLGTELPAGRVATAERLGGRIRDEWDRFLSNALLRLAGEERGSAHFVFPEGGWDAERATVRVLTWPPLPGEALPELE